MEEPPPGGVTGKCAYDGCPKPAGRYVQPRMAGLPVGRPVRVCQEHYQLHSAQPVPPHLRDDVTDDQDL